MTWNRYFFNRFSDPLPAPSWAAPGRSWAALGSLLAALGPFLGRPWPLLGGPWPLLAAPRTTQMAPKWVPRRTLLAIPVFGSFSIDFYSELRPPKTKKSLKFIGFYSILAFPAFCNLHPFWLRFGCQLGSILPPKIVQKIVQGASWRRLRASWAALGDS